MFSQLLSTLLGQPARPEMTEPDARHALGALLVRVAKSDQNYHVAEMRRIEKLLRNLHDLSAADATRMRTLCEQLEQTAPHTEIFVELVRQGVDFDERLETLEALWQVVLADGQQSPEEQATLRRIQAALGLTDADSITARSLALEHL